MEYKGDSNLGKKQLLLSQLGFEAKAKKVRTVQEVNEVERKDFTFELGASKEGRQITAGEGMQECISQVKNFILAKKIEFIKNEKGKYVVPEEDD